MRNRLHADLLVLLPGERSVAGRMVGPRRLALVASRLRRRSELQAELARARLATLRRLDVEIAALETRIAERVASHPLLAIPGVGPLVAGKLIGEVGDVSRLRSANGFAALAGVAPIPASSGQRQRMRLNRGGRSQLFSSSIAEDQFRSITGALGLLNTKRVEPGSRITAVDKFFRIHGPRIAPEQAERWKVAAPIVAAHSSYRATGDRLEWVEFCRDVIAGGLYVRKGWAPTAAHRPVPFYESPDFDPRDYMDVEGEGEGWQDE